MSHFYLIDASHFIFRAYHALPPLAREDGTPVGALYGFIAMLLKLVGTKKPEGLGVVFDSKAPTFRHTLFDAYKANRAVPPDDLVPQFDLVRQACDAFGLPCIAKEGLEADDLLASYACALSHKGQNVALVSSDKDLMQLLSDTIHLFDPMKEKWLSDDDVIKKFGVPPKDVLQVQALMGDASDNIPGIPGVGPKTAAALVQTYKTLETLYDHIADVKRERLRTLLAQHKENAFLSRTLALLKTDAPLSVPLDQLAFQGLDTEKGAAFLRAQGFETLLRRFLAQTNTAPPQKNLRLCVLDTKASLQAFAKKINQTGLCAVHPLYQAKTTKQKNAPDTKDSLFSQRATSFPPAFEGVVLATKNGSLGFVPAESLQAPDMLADIQTLMQAPFVLKIAHKSSALLDLFPQRTPCPLEDTALMGYLLFGPLKDDDSLPLYKRLGGEDVQLNLDAAKAFLENTKLSVDDLQTACLKADATHTAYLLGKAALKKKCLFALYKTLDLPLSGVLRRMEQQGICLEPKRLKDLGAAFEKTLDVRTQDVWRLAGKTFNVASPKQLSEILFTHMALKPPTKKGKTGVFSTSSDVLEAIDHPIIAPLLEIRQLSKLKSTYVDGLLQDMHPSTHKVHTTFQSTSTSTGRLSSINPNLQNIPVRTAQGRAIRGAFIPSLGCHFLSLDYSQIELRLLAHMGQVAPLIQAFRNGDDIHKKTASEMFEKKIEDVTEDERRTAKMINFGIIYGMSGYGLSERLAISRTKAEAYIKHYLKVYAGIEDYMQQCIDQAIKTGYVETLWGRRCYIGDIRHANYARRSAAERLAINAPLQGTSADLIKRAMLEVQKVLKPATPAADKERGSHSVVLLLQIHDELLFEGPPDALARLKPKLVACMESVAALQVPLRIDSKSGTSWEKVS
ncbi:MAG: DNA polymerase I [Holosporaceae bacterium]